jgi:20S proteasome alpha/beta subunit
LECQANAIGRQAKTVREFLEKNYDEEHSAKKLAIRSLMEVCLVIFQGDSRE